MNTPRTRQEVAALLQAHGVHATRQRIDVAHALFGQTRHLSAEDILEYLNTGPTTETDTDLGRGPLAGRSNDRPVTSRAVSKATVYNTLRLLLERGAIRALVVEATRVLYDPNNAPHHHFFNTLTGELTDFPAGPVTVEGLPVPPAGTVADGVDIVVRIRPTAQTSR